jgi:hypothetical protein
MAITVAMRTQVAQLYVSLFGRAPDGEGLGFWVGQLDAGQTLAQVAQSMYNVTAARAYYPAYATNEEIVATFYQNVLGRAVGTDTEGQAFWVAKMNAAGATKGSVITEMLNVVANYTGTDAAGVASKALFNNKVAVAQYYGEQNGSIAGATNALSGVTSDVATVATAKTAAAAAAASGSTFTLTTGVDSVVGTGGGDIFNASIITPNANTGTYGVSDTITDTGGNDTLNITVTGADATGGTAPVATVSGIETINVRAVMTTAANDIAVAAGTFVGATAINSDRSTSSVTVTGLSAAQSYGIIGNASITNGISNAGWGASVTAGTVNISGGTLGTSVVTTSGTLLATNTVNSTGAANVIGALTLGAAVTTLNVNAATALTTGAVTNTGAAALTKIVVTGAGAVNLSATAQQSTVTTIDASGATGALTVALGSAVTQKVTGGAGNDVITTGAILTTGSVDAGAGTGDVLDVGANVTHVNTAALAAKYTNFEILRVNGTMDMNLFPTFTSVQLSGATNAITNLSATEAAAISARADIGATTLTLANSTGTSDVLTITNGLGTTTAAATAMTTLTATGFETINLVANPGPSATSGANRTTSVTAIADTSLTAVNMTGTAFTLGDIASTKAVAWNASALTGNGASTPVGLTLTTTGAAGAGSVVTGSALRDSVIMDSSTGVTFNLGAGNDLFSTTSTLLLPSGAATDNTINGGDGTDKLIFTGAATLTDTSFTKVSGFEALELAGGGVDNSVTGLAAGFLSGFANGVTVTDTATQATAKTYTWSSGLYAQPVNLTHVTDAVGVTSSANQSITTGAGNDTITLTAASFTGLTAGVSQGQISVSTGAGNDTITVSTGTLNTAATARAVTITPGTGADVINITSHVNGAATTTLLGNVAIVVSAGESSTTAWDQITGFRAGVTTAGEVSDALTFSNKVLTAYTAAAPTGYTAAQLTVAVSAVGAVTFAGTSAAALTLADKISAIQAVVTTNNGDTAYFTDSGNTYVFNNETAGDVVVQLVGLTGVTALITTNAATANAVFLA